MKRAFLIALAGLIIAAPMAQAQQYRPDDRRPPQQHQVEPQRPAPHKFAPKPYYWKKGQSMRDWRRHNEIRDYRRYGLRKPGRDQRWIRVDNQYLLIGITSGLIVGIVSAR